MWHQAIWIVYNVRAIIKHTIYVTPQFQVESHNKIYLHVKELVSHQTNWCHINWCHQTFFIYIILKSDTMKQDSRGVTFSYLQHLSGVTEVNEAWVVLWNPKWWHHVSGVTEIKAAWVYLCGPERVTPLIWCHRNQAAWVYIHEPKMVTPLMWCPKRFNCVTSLN